MPTEADTCRKYVVPMLQSAGWDNEPHSIAEQRTITDGRIVPVGKGFMRKPPKRVDYLLRYTRDFPLAVVEAKATYKRAADGLQQAKLYAEMLGLKFAYATNVRDVIEFDYSTGLEKQIKEYPPPAELWQRYRHANGIKDNLVAERLLTPYNHAVGKTDLDRYGRPIPDDEYQTKDFEKVVALHARTEAIARHLTGFLKKSDRFAKPIVFCVDQEHASEMRSVLNNLNRDLVAKDPGCVCRVTSDEGDIGRGHLGRFQDVGTTVPVILTTSQLLTTGVDAPTCKNIVLARAIGSMSEFKQIIGRGTRVRDDYGKLWFNIIDYAADSIRTLCPTAPEFRAQWADPIKCSKIIQSLEERGINFADLAEAAKQPEADPFDLLCHLAFNAPLRARRERAQMLRDIRKDFFTQYAPEARQILDELLEKYPDHGAAQFVLPDVLKVPPVSMHGQIGDIIKTFGGADKLRNAVNQLQSLLYAA